MVYLLLDVEYRRIGGEDCSSLVGGSFTFYAYYDRRGGWIYGDPRFQGGLDSYFYDSRMRGRRNKRVNLMSCNIYCTYLRRVWTLLSLQSLSINSSPKGSSSSNLFFVSCGQYNLHLLLFGGTGGSIHSCRVVVVVVGSEGVGGCRRAITI